MKNKFVLMMAGMVVALAGCGGGGGNDGDRDPVGEETTVPDSVLQSPEALVAWVLSRQPSESKEPLAMSSTMPPASETAEPIDLD
jgi:hypothetical protein